MGQMMQQMAVANDGRADGRNEADDGMRRMGGGAAAAAQRARTIATAIAARHARKRKKRPAKPRARRSSIPTSTSSQVTVYGQARFFNPPPADAAAEPSPGETPAAPRPRHRRGATRRAIAGCQGRGAADSAASSRRRCSAGEAGVPAPSRAPPPRPSEARTRPPSQRRRQRRSRAKARRRRQGRAARPRPAKPAASPDRAESDPRGRAPSPDRLDRVRSPNPRT